MAHHTFECSPLLLVAATGSWYVCMTEVTYDHTVTRLTLGEKGCRFVYGRGFVISFYLCFLCVCVFSIFPLS